MFTPNDVSQIEKKGITLPEIEAQIANFKSGFPFMELAAPATLNNKGILQLTSEQLDFFTTFFEKESEQKDILKFVPASGAATRMFKSLFEYLSTCKNGVCPELSGESSKFFSSLNKFAFYNLLGKALQEDGFSLEECLQAKQYDIILEYFLNEKGLNYGKLPKALLEFHSYESSPRTSLEEHLSEGAHYAQKANNEVNIHFTVSDEHKVLFQNKIDAVKDTYEKLFGIKLKISFSVQKPKTDTIAVDLNNEIFRDLDGSLVFRPGGHGALIENLNDCTADVIFIKNIDNVVPECKSELTYTYKKACAGLLLELQSKIFRYLQALDNSTANLDEIQQFCIEKLNLSFEEKFRTLSAKEKAEVLKDKLNRPIRICGMVKNEGEPGGGPYWVKDNNELSLQIVESAQVDLKNPLQDSIFKSSTHFNPVDLICATKNYKGEKFDLKRFVNPRTGFIAEKSKDGKALKAQELPGLWNGAMYEWITLFVEVPLATFNPVKTVIDLLRPEHQE